MAGSTSAKVSQVNTAITRLPSPLPLEYDGHNLVFIVGCPRSGTSWLQKLIASYPTIRTGQESHIFTAHIGPQMRTWRRLGNTQKQYSGVGLSCYFTEAEVKRLMKKYLLSLLEPMVSGLRPGELFLEKTPSHSLFLEEIFEFLPRTRVIHIVRDARDVVSSLLARDEWISWWAPRKASDAAALWVRHMHSFQDALHVVPRERVHELRYEALTRTPIPVLQGCADFLGLKWSAEEIARVVEENQASKARENGGTRIPLSGEMAQRWGSQVNHPKGFVRKAKPGGWREDLSLSQKFWVWRVAHQTMNELGYRWPKNKEMAFACGSGCVDLAKRVLSLGRKGTTPANEK